MTFNKIPLALGFNSSTGNASGLVEFTLDLSNVGDVCDTPPGDGQSLVFSGDAWCPSTIVTGGGGGGGGGIPTPNTPLATGDILAYNGASWQATTTSELNLPTLNGTNTFTEANSFGVVGTKITTAGNLEIAGNTTINGTTGNLEVGSSFSVTNANGNVEIGCELSVQGSEFTSDGAVLANVDKNSLVITTNASAVSSLSGASGTVPYFEGTNPAPALQPITTILQNAAVRVEDKNLGDLANVAISDPGSIESGTPLVSRGGASWGPQGGSGGLIKAGNKSVSAVSGSFTVSNVVTVPPGFTGKGDTTVDSFIMFSGTDASSTEYVGTR